METEDTHDSRAIDLPGKLQYGEETRFGRLPKSRMRHISGFMSFRETSSCPRTKANEEPGIATEWVR